MPDPIQLVDRIAADLSTVRWPAASEIRGTARVRRRRRAALAAAAALVAVTGLSVAVDHGGESAPTAAAPPASEQIVIPQAALLTSDEIGPALEAQVRGAEAFLPTRTELGLDRCVEDKKLNIVHTSRYQREQSLLRTRPRGEEHVNSDLVLNQSIYRLSNGEASRFMADLRIAVDACDPWPSAEFVERDGKHVAAVGEYRFAVVAEHFAGDESIQLSARTESRLAATGQVIGRTGPALTAFVRVGDLITVIGPRTGTTDTELRRWSVIAARRLCWAANPAC
ncbi:MAG TPA: hypothetical protein VI011_04120 [Asanoa sp.]